MVGINGLGYQAVSAAQEAEAAAAAVPAASSSASAGDETLTVTVEFGGGLDLLFSKKPKHQLQLPAYVPLPEGAPATEARRKTNMRYLIHYLAKNLLQEREELFREGETVRPGILVLINDTDWELENELEYVLEPRDCITLISTLHGEAVVSSVGMGIMDHHGRTSRGGMRLAANDLLARMRIGARTKGHKVAPKESPVEPADR